MPTEDDVAAWDAEAERYDEPADHGLRDPAVREAWRRLLLERLPPEPASVADLGCGTGTPSVLLADEGYRVDAIDFSPVMLEKATQKAAGRAGLRVPKGDAYEPRADRGRRRMTALTDPSYWGTTIADERYVVIGEATV
jgi:SAM-dependent methyltransferase